MAQEKLDPKREYELETGKPAEIIIRYDSPEYLVWYINKRLNKAVEHGQACIFLGADECIGDGSVEHCWQCRKYHPAG